jgi:hypothetical protein
MEDRTRNGTFGGNNFLAFVVILGKNRPAMDPEFGGDGPQRPRGAS